MTKHELHNAINEYVKTYCLKVIKWLSDNGQDFSCSQPMNNSELESFYDEIINDIKNEGQ